MFDNPTLEQWFHPITARWFANRFAAPTDPQLQTWPSIVSGRPTLLAAPTGSGKTLAAFLSCIDDLLRQGIGGTLTAGIQVVYVSPLKALSNDIHRNLQQPLAEIQELAAESGYQFPPIEAFVRTGDTPASQRQAMLRSPPHILVTTPESLYLMLTSPRARELLRHVRTVIVDEIHALARDKRGSHLSLTLERLDALCSPPPLRIGLSATQKPLEPIADFLVGSRSARDLFGCHIIDTGHLRELDLAVEVPDTPLSAVCSNEVWKEIYDKLIERIESHRSTLIFVNTRRMAEKLSHELGEKLGDEWIASHHGSLSREIRLSAEQRLKDGKLKAIVATASLELGIDVGYIDLVCQIGSPRSIATFLQRVGRSGHAVGALPKGRLFAVTRDNLLECLSLIHSVHRGRLDAIEIPQKPLDVLAQQIVAAVSCEEMNEEELFDLCKGAWPYRQLTRDEFEEVLEILSVGVGHRGSKNSYLHRDRIQKKLRARRPARMAAIGSGGAIPENADYRVVTEPEHAFIGTVNEDFAIESMAGDIFQLGNMSWKIRQVRGGEVVVHDAEGQPATIPFWIGEAPGRTIELSEEVAELRTAVAEQLDETTDHAAAKVWLMDHAGANAHAADQATLYIAAQKAAIGLVPTHKKIVFERFFDESGGMQLVIHAPLGSRINRAWGLAMRKRFCRSFDFELQASADDNGVVLSIGPQHSFPIENLFRMLTVRNGRELLVQALLAAPMFQIRWRHNATRSLFVLRQKHGKKVPPPLQRFHADDLLTSVFPAASGCLENHHGDIEVPDHALVRQTIHDCLTEAMDIERWEQILRDIENGQIELIARDTREPSPFSHELLNANPYAFLDDAPLEERRARAVATRRTLQTGELADLARLDPEAITLVKRDAWPIARDADELHEALVLLCLLPEQDGADWKHQAEKLRQQKRLHVATLPDGRRYWMVPERWPLVRALDPAIACEPTVKLPPLLDKEFERTEALQLIVRGWIECCGPTTAELLAERLGLKEREVSLALEAIESQGLVLRGKFDPDIESLQWCERSLLARIHRLTLEGARRQIQPVPVDVYMEFLIDYQCAGSNTQREGSDGLVAVLEQLQGFETPAGAWEQEILPIRIKEYESTWLDEQMIRGQMQWGRLRPPKRSEEQGPFQQGLTRMVPLCIIRRSELSWLMPSDRGNPEDFLRGNARQVWETLGQCGALFKEDLQNASGLLPSHLDEALEELAAAGLVTADSFAPVRRRVGGALHSTHRKRSSKRRGPVLTAGRWSRFPAFSVTVPSDNVQRWARLLLHRYGVVCRDHWANEAVAMASVRWMDLSMELRRMEARGEIRGGRFLAGVAAQQFAVPSVVEQLRRLRQEPPVERTTIVSAADPINLPSPFLEGARVPAQLGNRIALRRGKIIAYRQGGKIVFTDDAPIEATLRAELETALARPAIVRAASPAPQRVSYPLDEAN